MDQLKAWLLHTFSALIILQRIVSVTLAGQVDIKLANHSQANIYCKHSGGLYQISADDKRRGFINDTAAWKNIQTGQSTWIMGYAKLSQIFSAYYGCYNVSTGTEIKFFTGVSFYNCTDICKDNSYMGIRNIQCICLHETNLSSLLKVEHALCRHFMDRFKSKDYGEFLTVYKLLNRSSSQVLRSPQYQQCVAVQMDNKTEYATKSCYSNITETHGYMCTKNVTGHTCRTLHFCIIKSKSSWLNAEQQCSNSNGKLLPYPVKEYEDLKDPKLYWSGMFRSFEIQKQSNESDACLSVTKVESKLMIEPDNCVDQKFVLCRNGQTETSEQPMMNTTKQHQLDTKSSTSLSHEANFNDTTTNSPSSQTTLSTIITTSGKNTKTSSISTNAPATLPCTEINQPHGTASSRSTKTNDHNATPKEYSSTPDLVMQASNGTRDFTILDTTTYPDIRTTSSNKNDDSDALYITISVAALIIIALISILIKLVLTRRAEKRINIGNSNQPLRTARPPVNNPIYNRVDVADEVVAYDMINLDSLPSSFLENHDQNQYDKIDLRRTNTNTAAIVNEYGTTRNISTLEGNHYDSVQSHISGKRKQAQNTNYATIDVTKRNI